MSFPASHFDDGDSGNGSSRHHFSRRRFLTGMGAAILGAGMLAPALRGAPAGGECWVSAQGDNREDFGLGWINADGAAGRKAITGFRGHALVQHSLRRQSIIFLARRPGTAAMEIDLRSGEVLHAFECEEGRHLFGHGCLSRDGRALFTTEADIDRGVGKIVVRDADNYAVLQEWPSYGVGAHDAQVLPDGKTLVVANGGILTRPRSGRKPLNLASMQSSLSYIDIGTGTLIDDYRVPESKASIRHLDVAADGTVAFAMQLQRQAAGHDKTVPLTGVHRPGENLTLHNTPTVLIDRLADYVGSTAVCNESRIAGYASPRGNLAVFWHIDDGRLAGYHPLRDVCGIAVSQSRQAFVLSNSLGELRELDMVTLQERREQRVIMPGVRWDNHLLIAS